MNETALPPSPNWYLNNILVYSRQGTVAWGAKNNIVIAKGKENQTLEFSLIKDAHKDRTTALAFCSKIEPDCPELLISGGDDDKVKIWNVDTLQLVTVFSFNDDRPIIGVDWFIKDNKHACAVNLDGVLFSCNTQYETFKKISLGKLSATCLACCPHNSSLVAVGSKSGLVYIVDLDKNESILYRLRGHNDEIISLSWCPSDVNIFQEDNKRDLLLASGGKDRCVFIWKAGGDGRYETVINIPKQPIAGDSQPHKSKLNPSVGSWITVCWAEPKLLLTSSIWGELLSWDLSANNSKPVCQLFHTYHNRGLFCIATSSKYNSISDNLRADSELTVWTLAQNRWVVCCRKQKNEPVESKYKIPTQGGFIYCIAASPIDTSRIAFGVGDNMLRLWNLSESHVTTFDVTMFWQKIKGKLRAIAWNPVCERTLAFATSEGRVGVFDVISNNPILFRQYHRNTVYKLEWGHVRNKNIFGVFSCAEGELVVYDAKNPDSEPISIIKEGCTEFSWKPDQLLLAVALENGSIVFYDQNLKKYGNAIYVLKNTINCLAWHPESTAADSWSSPMKDYLAVASDLSTIIIFDVSDMSKQLETRDNIIDVTENGDCSQQRNIHKIVASLNGHTNKVVCLAWSPHFSGHLVSGSYDETVQVWNVETQELMGTYTGHNGPVLCCMWSPLKPQLIITGSADFMLRIWDYTLPAQSPKQLSDSKKQSKYKKRKKNKMADNLEVQDTSNPTNFNSIENSTDPNSMTNSTNFNSIMNSPNPADQSATVCPTEVTESNNRLSSIKDAKKKEKKLYFPTYGKAINDKSNIVNCIRSDIGKKQKEDSDLQNEEKDDVKLSLFTEKENLLVIVANEKRVFAAKSKYNTVAEMDLWCDNLKQNLECAVKEKHLSDFLVSVSSSLSMKMWKEMCEAYAHQLIMEGNMEKAVSYFLCIHKIYEAIKVFLDAKMYREAYVLARFKLDSDDPVLAIILQSWAQYANNNGQLEQAAHCYVKLGELTKAAKVLARRNDLQCLEIASELAFMTGDEEFGISLAEEATVCALMKSEYSKAYSIIENIRQSQHLKIHINAHETVMLAYKKQTSCDLMRTWFEGKSDRGVLQVLKEKYDFSHYDALRTSNTANIAMESQATVQLYTTYQIAMAATCDARETQLKHIVMALSNIFQYETAGEKHSLKYTETEFFTYILAILDAAKPTDKDSIYAKSDYPISASIRAYLCAGLLNWLISDLEQLSIEEETQFTELIEVLLDDAFQQVVKDNINQIDKIKELESRLASLMINKMDETEDEKKDWTNLTKEIDNLKFDKKRFIKERVCTPDPHLIYNQALDLSKILRDDTNRSRFSEVLDNKYKTIIE